MFHQAGQIFFYTSFPEIYLSGIFKNKIDFILAVGGGNVMDCAKAVSMAAVYGGDLWNDFFVRHGIMDFDPVPLGAVVTETKTGSEMNGRAVITNKVLKVRTGLSQV